MAWSQCDHCKGEIYTAENPFVEFRTRRPSDPREMCCVMAGHKQCLNVTDIPSIGNEGGVATRQQWEEWIESKAALDAGFMFLG